jgi:uncharacterized protein (TIGR02147 family)
MKSIFEYDDYRKFLKAVFEFKKSQDSSFSQRNFAKLLGASNSSFYSMVVTGKRNISDKVAQKIADGLALKNDEAFFFKNLVLLNQAVGLEERQLYAQAVLKSRGFRRTKPLAELQYRYWTQWYYVAIRELVTLADFKEDPVWIAHRLSNQIKPDQAMEAIEVLLQLDLLARDEKHQLQPVHEAVITPDEVTSPFLAQFHEQMIKLAVEAIRHYPREIREVSGLTFPISELGFKKVKGIIQNFRKELLEIVTQERDSKGVYQFNLQFFPLAPIETKKK